MKIKVKKTVDQRIRGNVCFLKNEKREKGGREEGYCTLN